MYYHVFIYSHDELECIIICIYSYIYIYYDIYIYICTVYRWFEFTVIFPANDPKKGVGALLPGQRFVGPALDFLDFSCTHRWQATGTFYLQLTGQFPCFKGEQNNDDFRDSYCAEIA